MLGKFLGLLKETILTEYEAVLLVSTRRSVIRQLGLGLETGWRT